MRGWVAVTPELFPCWFYDFYSIIPSHVSAMNSDHSDKILLINSDPHLKRPYLQQKSRHTNWALKLPALFRRLVAISSLTRPKSPDYHWSGYCIFLSREKSLKIYAAIKKTLSSNLYFSQDLVFSVIWALAVTQPVRASKTSWTCQLTCDINVNLFTFHLILHNEDLWY